ncbi:MAG: hypothetical protein ACYTEX_23350 [Planctomycetota bacterium]|jgi:hypothetical protein
MKPSRIHNEEGDFRRLSVRADGLRIGGAGLYADRDPNNNLDPYWRRPDGTSVNLTGEVLMCRATSDLTLTTTDQSIVGGGDSTKVRHLLPTIGEWHVTAFVDFEVSATDPDECVGRLYVNDSGTPETGSVQFGEGQVNRGTPGQQWKVTTTAEDTPIELMARKVTNAGTAKAKATHTTLAATLGAGGGSTVEAIDHGTQTGRDDDDHTQYLLNDGTRTGAQSQAQDFGSNGIKADVIAESTGAAGVTARFQWVTWPLTTVHQTQRTRLRAPVMAQRTPWPAKTTFTNKGFSPQRATFLGTQRHRYG